MSTISSGTTLTTALVQTGDTTGNLVINTGSSNTTAMTISGSTQNVGIGTSSPSSDAIVKFLAVSNATSAGVVMDATAAKKFSIYSSSSSTLTFRDETAGATRMYIDSSGRLSVGVTGFQTGSATGSIQIAEGAIFASGGFGRVWRPGQQIGSVSNAGLYGLSTTYLAYYDAGWKSLGGGTASALTMDEGILAFANSNGVGSAGSALTWTTRLVVDNSGNLLFNSGYGSAAIAYGCRAWVNFNGTGTVAIRSSSNVSSVSDNGTGQYTVNLASAMPDANYSAVVSCNGTGSSVFAGLRGTPTTTSFGVGTIFPGVQYEDHSVVCAAIFR